jgi:hypothetical protein
MHKSDKFIRDLLYGFDQHNLYFRLDADGSLGMQEQGISVKVEFIDGKKDAVIEFGPGDRSIKAEGINHGNIYFAANDVFEASIPFDSISHLAESMEIKCIVYIMKGGSEIQRVPEKGALRIQVPDKDFELYNWKA